MEMQEGLGRQAFHSSLVIDDVGRCILVTWAGIGYLRLFLLGVFNS